MKKYLRFALMCVILAAVVLGCPSPGGGSSTTYTVTYNANGATSGNVPTDSNTYKQGATVTVLGNTGNLSITGGGFYCWKDGSGTYFNPGVTFIMGSANVNLYAVWLF